MSDYSPHTDEFPQPTSSRAADRAAGVAVLMLPEAVAAVLAVVAAHDELSPESWIARAVVRRADAIGLSPLVDRMQDGSGGSPLHGNSQAQPCRDFGRGAA